MNHLPVPLRPPVLDALGLPNFSPLPGLSSGSLQTIAGVYWPHRADLPGGVAHQLSLGGSDSTLALVNRPVAWEPGDRVAVLIHGLVGDQSSSYMVRLARRLYDECYLVVRVNLRNAGPAFGLSRKTYHGGVTDDVRAMLEWTSSQYPGSDIAAFGFSLGGNLLLKAAAEDGSRILPALRTISTVSPAIDLERASVRLASYPGRFFARSFLRLMIYDLKRLRELFPDDFEPLGISMKTSIREFDTLHMAKYHGINVVEDYYRRSSSLHQLEQIRVPTLVLGAADDPVIDLSGLLEKRLPAHVETIFTRYGGHVGYIGRGHDGTSLRWSDDVLMRWLEVRWGRARQAPTTSVASTAKPAAVTTPRRSVPPPDAAQIA